MMSPPGTFRWLLAQDLRLNWRRFAGMFGGLDLRLAALLLSVGVVLLHLAAWPLVRWLSPFVYGVDAATTPIATFAACTFTWMIAQSLFGISRVLFDRGDLDLLLGSPLSAARVFAAKAIAVATGTFGSIAVLLLPLANTGALIDRAAWLGFYPVLIGLALLATAISIAIAIGLFFLVGPRRARVQTQMVGATIGGIFVLGAQIAAMLPLAMRDAIVDWFSGSALSRGQGIAALFWLPVDGLRGDQVALMLLFCAGALALATAVAALGERFARASLAAAGAAIETDAGKSGRKQFSGGIGRNLRLKEWRLLLRDPNLFAQVGLQIIYTIPITVVLLRNENLPAVFALAPTIVVVASQVAASLAWIVVSGEDAPELIASAPVQSRAVDRAKLSAIALPVSAIVALPLIGLAIVSPFAAVMAALFSAGAAGCTGLLNLWHPMPGNRRGMLRRHSQSKLIGLMEHGIAVSWGIAVVLAMLASFYALLPIVVAGGVVIAARYRTANLNKTSETAVIGAVVGGMTP